MDRSQLDELERLAKAATPGPWRVESEVSRDSMGLFWPITSIEGAEDNVTENVTTDDAAYIVAACNAVPELLKMYREADDEAADANSAWQKVRRENLALREQVRELERQREFFLKALNDNRLCPSGGCFHDGSDLDEWDCTSFDNRECWIHAAKEAGE